MADTFTAVYGWTKPQVAADNNIWGGLLNADLDSIDTTVAAVSTVANAAMPKAGGTFTGGVTGTSYSVSGAAGTARPLRHQTAGSDRWVVQADSTAEGGANSGSDFRVSRYTDGGALIDTPLLINRATGAITLAGALTVTGAFTASAGGVLTSFNGRGTAAAVLSSADVTGALTFTPANKAGDTFSGDVLVRVASSTTLQNYLELRPTDYTGVVASGIPALVCQKLATAGDWQFGLFDGSFGVGRLGITASAVGIGTTAPVKALHVQATIGEIELQSTQGLADWRSWNLLVDGTPGAKQNFSLRLLSDNGITAQWIGMAVSGTTGVANFPQGLTSNGVAPALVSDAHITGLPINSQAGNYAVLSSDYGGCVHFTANATVTLPTAPIGTAYEISCDAGVTVSFTYANTLRTVPANGTGAHTLVGPGSAFCEQKKATEIWARGEIV